jgi:hypothetical protein
MAGQAGPRLGYNFPPDIPASGFGVLLGGKGASKGGEEVSQASS